MKSPSTRGLPTLTAQLRGLRDEYALIRESLERIDSAIASGGAAVPQLAIELETLVGCIDCQDQLIREVRSEWGRQGGLTDEFRIAVDAAAAELLQLIAGVQSCEQRLRSARDRLHPELDQVTRHQEMQRAYGGSYRLVSHRN